MKKNPNFKFPDEYKLVYVGDDGKQIEVLRSTKKLRNTLIAACYLTNMMTLEPGVELESFHCFLTRYIFKLTSYKSITKVVKLYKDLKL